MDRTYWHVPGARSWHAGPPGYHWYSGILTCGRVLNSEPESADRVPRDGHLCGSCSRIIAARTDIEDVGMYPTIQHDDVPEPVASEQDDSGIAPI